MTMIVITAAIAYMGIASRPAEMAYGLSGLGLR